MEPGIKNCCICGREFIGEGHNPSPVMESDFECCDECNASVVLPNRIALQKQNEAMKTDFEKIKEFIKKQIDEKDKNVQICLLQELAWWAADEAGMLDYGEPDVEMVDYE